MAKSTVSSDLRLQMVSVVIHACASVARNPKTYQAFHRATKGKFQYRDLKRFMQDSSAEFIHSKFAQMRSSSLTIKALEVYSTCGVLQNVGSSSKFFIDFLFKHYPRFSTELSKHKQEFPERSFFSYGTNSIDEVVEKACVYQMMLSRICDDGYFVSDDQRVVKISREVSYLFEYAKLVISLPDMHEKSKGRHITEVERFLQKTLVGKHKSPFLSYFSTSTANALQDFAQEFCNGDLMSFKFNEKDGVAMAKNIYKSLQVQLVYQKLTEGGKQPSVKDLSIDVNDQRFHFSKSKYEDIFKDFDVNYFRFLYAFGKLSQNDCKELMKMFLQALPDDAETASISKEELQLLRQQLAEKDSLLEKKQEALNRVQLELDREKKTAGELREDLQEATSSLQDMQELLETISNPQTKMDDIDSTETYAFPTSTILFGGHPNWQRKFKLLYPAVKVYDSNDLNFPPDIIRNADLVLLNVSHMAHKQYYRIIQEVRKHHIHLEYIK